MPDINSLSLHIVASAAQANKSIDDVIAKLGALQDALNGLNARGIGDSISGLAAPVERLANATAKLDGGKLKTVSTGLNSLANSAAKLSNVGNVGEVIRDVAGGLKFLNNIGDMPGSEGITKLTNALTRLGGKSAAQATTTIPAIADGLNEISNAAVRVPDTSALLSLAPNVSALGTKAVGNGASNMGVIAAGIGALKAAGETGGEIQNAAAIRDLGSAVSRFGYKSVDSAIINIPKVAQAFRQLLTTLKGAPVVRKDILNLANSLAIVATNVRSSSAAMTQSAHGFKLFSVNTRTAARSAFSLASAIGRLYATFFWLRYLFNFGKQALELSSDLTEVQNVVDVSFREARDRVQEFSQTTKRSFGIIELTAKRISSRYQAMANAMGLVDEQAQSTNQFLTEQGVLYGNTSAGVADMSISLTKLAADMGSFFNVDVADVADDLQAVFTGLSRPLRKYGIDLTQTTMQEWALAHGIEADVKSMTQAEKTLLRYQMVLAQTRDIQGDFQRTSSTWANTTRVLRQSFQELATVIGTGLIHAFKPFVQSVSRAMNTVISLVQSTLNALGRIFGWQIEISNVGVSDDMEDFAESAEDAAGGAGKAADAAKKLKSYVAGIDELNIFEPPKDNDKGGGGGGAADDITDAINNALGGRVQIKATDRFYDSMINSLYGLGRKIGDTLSEMMEGIDWQKAYEKSRRFGYGLADFLNGLISPRLFENVGKTIAGSLNKSIHFLDSFGERFSWKNFGDSLAAGVNGFFKTFDSFTLSEGLNKWANGLLDALIVFLDRVDWDLIGLSIGVAFSRIDWIGITKKLAKAFWKAMNAAFRVTSAAFKGTTYNVSALNNVASGIAAITLAAKLFMATGIVSFLSKVAAGFVAVVGTVKTLATYIVAAKGSFTAFMGLLSPMARGFIAIGTVVAEVVTTFSFFKDVGAWIVDSGREIDNFHGKLLLMEGAIAAAAFALTAVFGVPAGLIITGVAAGVTALVGLQNAFLEIKTENLQKAISDVFQPGGVPIEDLAADATDAVKDIGNSFEELAGKASGISSANQQLADSKLHIENIGRAMETGAIDTEEGVERIKVALSDLAETTKLKMDETQEYLTSVFNENGYMGQVFASLGVDLGATNDAIVEITERTKKRMEELQQEYNTIINSPGPVDWAAAENIKQQILELSGAKDEVTETVSTIRNTVEHADIDWSSLLDTEGQLDTEKFASVMAGITVPVEDAIAKIQASAPQMEESINTLVNGAESIGQHDLGGTVGMALDVVPQAIEIATEDVKTYAENWGIEAQNSLVASIQDVALKANEEWDKSGGGLAGFATKGDYVAAAVKAHKENVIDPVTQELETQYKELGIAAKPYASDAAEQIIEGMFDEESIRTAWNSKKMVSVLTEGWEGIFDEVNATLPEPAETIGTSIMDGAAQGVTNNVDAYTGALEEAARTGIETFKNINEVHSPSKVFDGIAQDNMLGLAGGVETGAENYYTALETAATTGMERFKEALTPESLSGMFDGMQPGLQTAWDNALLWWNEEAMPLWKESNVTTWFSAEQWTEDTAGIQEGLLTTWENTSIAWFETLDGWEAQTKEYFTADRWKENLAGVKLGFQSAFESALQAVVSVMNRMLGAVETTLNNSIGGINEMISIANQFPDVSLSTVSTITIGRIGKFQDGGYPTSASLFWAGENGIPELVGSIGGQSAVASGNEITGIRQAVANSSDREVALMNEIINIARDILRKDNSVVIGDREIALAARDGAVKLGRTLFT